MWTILIFIGFVVGSTEPFSGYLTWLKKKKNTDIEWRYVNINWAVYVENNFSIEWYSQKNSCELSR